MFSDEASGVSAFVPGNADFCLFAGDLDSLLLTVGFANPLLWIKGDSAPSSAAFVCFLVRTALIFRVGGL